MKTFVQIALLLALMGLMFCVAVLARIVGPTATLPTLVLLALAQALIATLAIRTAIGLG